MARVIEAVDERALWVVEGAVTGTPIAALGWDGTHILAFRTQAEAEAARPYPAARVTRYVPCAGVGGGGNAE